MFIGAGDGETNYKNLHCCMTWLPILFAVDGEGS